ncbi:hypothetical protein [Helicobacter sp. 11S02596-1]|nr:hypothetical protein [Helicobacter sp. 11S02596-1]
MKTLIISILGIIWLSGCAASTDSSVLAMGASSNMASKASQQTIWIPRQ